MTTTDALVAFLLARLDETEQVAHAAGGVHWRRGAPNLAAEWDPDERPWRDDYDSICEANAPHEIVVYDEGRPNDGQLDHITLNDPARVLADVAAKRRIVELMAHVLHAFDNREAGLWPDVTRRERDHARVILEQSALPFASHPEYDESWRP